MNTLAERLEWAMVCADMNPHTDQSELARLVGGKCKPQNIQSILSGSQKTSKYTPRIAQVLGCETLWLSDGIGKAPTRRQHKSDASDALVRTSIESLTDQSNAEAGDTLESRDDEQDPMKQLPAELQTLLTAYNDGGAAKQEALRRLAELPEPEMATLLLVLQSIGAKYKSDPSAG